MEPIFVLKNEKVVSRCTAGHEREWDTSNWNAAPVWLSVDGKKFCVRCICDKLLELGIGQEGEK